MAASRGRPPADATRKRNALACIPPHILVRVMKRGGKTSERWRQVLENMRRHALEVEIYRRHFGINQQAAEVLLSYSIEAIPVKDVKGALQKVKHWQSMGSSGGRAKAQTRPCWEVYVTNEADRYSDKSASRAAHLISSKWNSDLCERPRVDTIRKFVAKQRKKLAR